MQSQDSGAATGDSNPTHLVFAISSSKLTRSSEDDPPSVNDTLDSGLATSVMPTSSSLRLDDGTMAEADPPSADDCIALELSLSRCMCVRVVFKTWGRCWNASEQSQANRRVFVHDPVIMQAFSAETQQKFATLFSKIPALMQALTR